MRIRQRLIRLERITRNRTVPPTGVSSERPLSEDEEADRTGVFLWLTADWERHAQQLARDPLTADKAAAYRAWDLAAKAARAAGHTAYHVGLRTEAMAVWNTMKPDILEHERTHGRWISIEPAPGNQAPSPEEFDALPLAERIHILRSPNLFPGFWSKDRADDDVTAKQEVTQSGRSKAGLDGNRTTCHFHFDWLV